MSTEVNCKYEIIWSYLFWVRLCFTINRIIYEAFMKAFLEGYLPDGKEDTKGTEGNDDKKTKDIDYIINRIINYNLAM